MAGIKTNLECDDATGGGGKNQKKIKIKGSEAKVKHHTCARLIRRIPITTLGNIIILSTRDPLSREGWDF